MPDKTKKENSGTPSTFVEGVHFYYNSEGLMVLTERYLRERGYCCKNACKHCPWGFKR